jgi:predicted permease
MRWNDLHLRLRALLFRQQVETELDEELGFHIEMQTRKNLDLGMSPAEARRSARIQFGVGDVAKEECRDARRISFVEHLFQDVRYALRGFRRRPLFAFAVIGTIALGLGWNTAVFTVFNAYVLRPLAVRDPYSLYRIDWTDRRGQGHGFTWSQFQDLGASQRSFTQISAFLPFGKRMDGRFAQGMLVSEDYFEMLGVPAFLGQARLPADSGAEPAIVLSYAAWRNRFAADANIVGRMVSLQGHPFRVAGVMPESFSGLDTRFRFDFWAPIETGRLLLDGPDLFGSTQPEKINVAGRLKADVSLKQAQSEMTVWLQRITALKPPEQRAAGATLYSVATGVRRNGVFTAILVISIPFGVVLLSACANVANMMLARALARQREIGIRLSLGAGRARLIQQLLTEAVLLALPAAAAGLAIAQATILLGERALFATIPASFLEYIRIAPLAPDARVFGFVLMAAIASALLFGLVPAIQATRPNLMQAAHGLFSGGFQPSRLRNALVVAQVTVSALFLIVCGLFLRGANHIQGLDTGMRTRDAMEIEIQEKSRERALRKLAAAPGVDLLAAAAHPPLDSRLPGTLGGRADGSELIRLPYTYTSPGYFQVFDIPIVRGRNFTVGEAGSRAAVAILSESAARRLWPKRDAIGQAVRLSLDNEQPAGQRPPGQALVIGIARDTIVSLADADEGRTCLYFPAGLESPGSVLLARVPDGPEAAKQRIRALLEAGDPGAVERIDHMQSFVDVRDYPFRAVYWVSAALGGLALLFTLSGIYGIVSYTVTQRTKEIGIRMAMGASVRAAIGVVVSQSVRLAAWGVAVGVGLSLGVAKLLSTQVVIDPFDALAYFGGIALVLAACIAAALFPAGRVARIDPISTLRYD